ncbi:hypothetical protein E4Z98_07440 [Vagococcus xieshaowenii]|uniref:Uncharacterized protein n=2 Tax=Vagococcus xieshaowenii TaxID=2562451 RepID=A0AAJ5EF99_9ENTE|nr:hypothetical protein E4Z98_07440 [Vagococcus xieshaowenii]TFZ41027.1 hypothetical protein E4031_05655 [Vagococcus xieshaowenii]
MNEILENILSYNEWLEIDTDPQTNQPLRYEVEKVFDENRVVSIKGTDFQFNYIKYSYDSLLSGQETNPIATERLKTTHGGFVIYTDGLRTQYLMDKARGPQSLRVLRKVNNSDKNKIIEAESFNINEEFFIWLLSRFMNDNKVLDDNNDLTISRIIGFKGEGNPNEKEAVLSGSGNEVMNLISSISFLIEMQSMTEIEVRVVIEDETYEIRYFSRNSQIDIMVENYSGQFMLDVREEKVSKILLKAFIEIIPSMMNSFNEDVENGEWTNNSKRDFTLALVDSVRNKLDSMYGLENE